MAFMRAYQDMVFTTAARLTGDDRLAEDISQDVFLRAYEHFEMLQSSPTPGGWLKTVATNLALNVLTRHRKRWRSFSELSADDEHHSAIEWQVPDSILAELTAEQRRAAVDQALDHLPAHQRIPLVLYHFEDMPYEAIANRLQVSLTKIKTDIRRGRAALLPLLAAAGIVRESS